MNYRNSGGVINSVWSGDPVEGMLRVMTASFAWCEFGGGFKGNAEGSHYKISDLETNLNYLCYLFLRTIIQSKLW